MYNKILNNFNKQSLIELVVFVSIWISISVFLSVAFFGYTRGIDYDVNTISTLRNMIYIGIFPALIVVIKLKLKDRQLIIVSSIIYIIGIAAIVMLSNSYTLLAWNSPLIAGSVLLGVMVIYDLTVNYKFTKWQDDFLKYSLPIFCFVAFAVLAFLPRFLNYESDVREEYLSEVPTYKGVDVELNDNSFLAIKDKLASLNESGVNRYIPSLNTKNKTINLKLGPDMEWVCEFQDQTDSDTSCKYYLSNGDKVSLGQKIRYINGLHITPENLKYIIQRQYLQQEYSVPVLGDKYWLLLQMLNRGHVFHHYSSILDGLDTGLETSYYNQYGLAPLSVIYAISNVLNSSTFDSVFFAIFLVNFIALLAALLINKRLIYAGYITSLVVVICGSNYFAPMVYFVRYIGFLPFVLLLYFHRPCQLDAPKLIKCAAYISAFIIGIAIKEYALIFAAASIFCYLIRKNSEYLKYLLFDIIGFICAIVFSHSEALHGTNFLSLIGGVGFDSSSGIPLAITLFYSIYLAACLQKKYFVFDDSTFMQLVLICFMIVKFITNPSPNHLGPMIFLLSLSISNAVFLNLEFRRKVYVTTYLYFIGMAIISTSGLFRINFTQEMQGLKYSIAHFTNAFHVDRNLLNKGLELSSIYRTNDFVISRQDDFLRIYLNSRLTGSYPNLSTNLNTPKDISEYKNEINQSKRLIVDNSIANKAITDRLYSEYYNIDRKLNDHIKAYAEIDKKYNTLLLSVLRNRVATNRTEHFTVYEIKESK